MKRRILITALLCSFGLATFAESESKEEKKPKTPRIDIKKVSIQPHESSKKFNGFEPTVTIDGRAPIETLAMAPVVTITILVSDKETGIYETFKYYYNWTKGWDRYMDSGQFTYDPAKQSKAAPQTDYTKLSPITLKKYGKTWGAWFETDYKSTPKIIAYKTCVWIDGEIVSEQLTNKDRAKLPEDWEKSEPPKTD